LNFAAPRGIDILGTRLYIADFSIDKVVNNKINLKYEKTIQPK